MKIRRIEIGDSDEIYKLLNELNEGRIDYNIFINKYKKNINKTDFYGIVAEINKKVVGVLIARLIDRLTKKNKTLYIDDLIIERDYRSKGIGKELLQSAVNYAKENKYGQIELTSYIPNQKAQDFYIKNGFKKHSYKFKQEIS